MYKKILYILSILIFAVAAIYFFAFAFSFKKVFNPSGVEVRGSR